MSNLLIIRPQPIVAVTNTGGIGSPGNILTPDPKEVATLSGSAQWTFDVDLGAAYLVDSFFLGHHNLPADGASGLGTITGGTASPTTTTFSSAAPGSSRAPSSFAAPRRQHDFLRLGAPVNARYFRIWVNNAQPGTRYFGIFAVGLAFQPAFNHEWGSGRQPIDLSSVSELPSGGFGIEPGAKKSAWKFQVGDLSDTETQILWDLAEQVGISMPVLVCEDPDRTAGLNERLHYGLFTNPEAYERMSPNRARWSFQVKQWV